MRGDLLIVAAFAWIDRDEAIQADPVVVQVDEVDRIAAISK